MSPEILTIIGVGIALAVIILAHMIFSEQDRINKRLDRLEGLNSVRPPFEERPKESLEQRVAYLEGLIKGRTGENPF